MSSKQRLLHVAIDRPLDYAIHSCSIANFLNNSPLQAYDDIIGIITKFYKPTNCSLANLSCEPTFKEHKDMLKETKQRILQNSSSPLLNFQVFAIDIPSKFSRFQRHSKWNRLIYVMSQLLIWFIIAIAIAHQDLETCVWILMIVLSSIFVCCCGICLVEDQYPSDCTAIPLFQLDKQKEAIHWSRLFGKIPKIGLGHECRRNDGPEDMRKRYNSKSLEINECTTFIQEQNRSDNCDNNHLLYCYDYCIEVEFTDDKARNEFINKCSQFIALKPDPSCTAKCDTYYPYRSHHFQAKIEPNAGKSRWCGDIIVINCRSKYGVLALGFIIGVLRRFCLLSFLFCVLWKWRSRKIKIIKYVGFSSNDHAPLPIN